MRMIDHGNAHSAYRNIRFFGSLDGLRCLCIALVIWHHRPQLFLDTVELPRLLSRGFAGVDFFFVLSGFLITTLLLREEERTGSFSIAGFYRRRVLRIVPIYFLIVTLCAVWWIGVRGQDQWLPYLPYYYVFLANFLDSDIPLLSPTWSLSVEEQYYLVWPALLLLLPWRNLRAPLLVAVIALAVLTDGGQLPPIEPVGPTGQARFILPMGSYSAILIGSLMAITLHNPKGFAVFWRLFGYHSAPLVLLLLLLVFWQVLPATLSGWPNFVMHSTMAAVLASLVLREDHILAPAFRLRPVARIGAISYGIYLWHLIGLHIGNEAAQAAGFEGVQAGWVALPIFICASLVLAEISFRWFESYFLALKSKGKRNPVAG